MNEEAVRFGTSDGLVGIVTPAAGRETQYPSTAVILLNAGIVHRVGAGRVYVKLARSLAAAGFVAFRFDFSGIGDSSVRQDRLTFEKSAIAETQDALDFLSATKGIRQFILLGGCSGARVAFNTAGCDDRVIGAILINFPSVEEDDAGDTPNAADRSAFFYYRRFALFNAASWLRLATGKAKYRSLIRALWFAVRRSVVADESTSNRAQQFRIAVRRLVERGVRLSFVCSEGDHRLDELRIAGGRELRRLCRDHELTLDIIEGSDHTFSSLEDQQCLIQTISMRARITRSDPKQFATRSSLRSVQTIWSGQPQS